MSKTNVDEQLHNRVAMDPVHVVQEQVDAFNARDPERFASCYSVDAVMTDGAGNVIAQGRDGIGSLWGQALLNSPSIHADIPARICIGSWVIDEDHTTGLNLAGFPPEMHMPVVYQVKDGKIVKCMALM